MSVAKTAAKERRVARMSGTAAIIAVMPRSELFDLAVERADTYLSRLTPGWEWNKPSAQELAATIELWYLRTRFAYRVPLDNVVATLLTKPSVEPYLTHPKSAGLPADRGGAPANQVAPAPVWRGGPEGRWFSAPEEDPSAGAG